MPRPSMAGALQIDRIGDLLFRAVAPREARQHLCRGQMFDRSGRLVATAMQEGLLRVGEQGLRAGERRLAG